MRQVWRQLSGSDSCDKEFLIICVGDPWDPNNLILGSAGEQFVDARPTKEWMKMKSRRTYLNKKILEGHGITLQCPGCEGRGPRSD